MKYIPLAFDVTLGPEGIVIDLDSLFAALTELRDRRDAGALRYALVTVLVLIVLAKLDGKTLLPSRSIKNLLSMIAKAGDVVACLVHCLPTNHLPFSLDLDDCVQT
jgi:hypothetical protein